MRTVTHSLHRGHGESSANKREDNQSVYQYFIGCHDVKDNLLRTKVYLGLPGFTQRDFELSLGQCAYYSPDDQLLFELRAVRFEGSLVHVAVTVWTKPAEIEAVKQRNNLTS
jgi:hypothetical protein